MGLSRRQYARHRGVSEMAVRKAIAAGRITLEPDGTIDPDKADRQWDERTDPAKTRGRAVPRDAVEAVDEALGESRGNSGAVFMRARAANEVIKVRTGRLKLQKLEGELVDRRRAEEMIFDLARRERDAWIGWPARVAARMAAELGVEPRLVETVLDRFIREHLEELAEIALELR
ncbi:hypothetical protein SAMN05216257_1157 [Meinhardsimonia xiamenensis]|uniref:Elements of external origin n=1 Tax=Meinhardsimonia xiamenensis TaxID=990712 RepID=A0A1G9HHW4_9RHOB|nr:elements of external origin [Meinhardsimonia xiamenensis]PRX27774.1 hypothetical protein LV81_03029 [Meinhardsimonia xiamenensis]SDL12550.1 hypothetical protein SAMN05216257_1157 [Meinhardsimonia xiamenensis]